MSNQNQNNPRKPPLPPSAAATVAAAVTSLGARSPCGACKQRRQLCTARCPLAPYFPAYKQRDFYNVNRLFGIQRFLKIVKAAPLHQREDAAKSIIYEANFRAENPVGGCCAAIKELLRQYFACKAELRRITKYLASCGENQETELTIQELEI